MKTITLDNIISNKELFFMYKEIHETPMWSVSGLTDGNHYDKNFNFSPVLSVKKDTILSYPFYLWGKTLMYRIENQLKDKNIGIPTDIHRMWFNITYSDNNQHWLHTDTEDSSIVSVVLFLTPIWLPEWKGSFYVDGKKFDFKPGSAVIFNSNEYHMGEPPAEKMPGWMRLTCNILLKK